jgi:hypothetical protein
MVEELARYLRFQTGGVTVNRRELRVEGHVHARPLYQKLQADVRKMHGRYPLLKFAVETHPAGGGHVAITPREGKGPAAKAKLLELITKLEPKR